jgi:hypothetical protein
VNAKVESVEAGVDASKPEKHVLVHLSATKTAKTMPNLEK